MPRLFRHVDDVALVGEEDRQRADAVANLPLENEPELRRLEMKVPLVVRCGLLWLAANDVGERAIIRDEAARGVGARGRGVAFSRRPVSRVVRGFAAASKL